jgi:aspartate 1-decarboxylase
VRPGDLVIIAAYGNFTEEEARTLEPKVVLVDTHNRLLTPDVMGA